MLMGQFLGELILELAGMILEYFLELFFYYSGCATLYIVTFGGRVAWIKSLFVISDRFKRRLKFDTKCLIGILAWTALIGSVWFLHRWL